MRRKSCWQLPLSLIHILLLLDINLPGGEDGFRLCTQIRGFSQIPIIFVTSRNTDMDELNSITLGGDDFITKPYNTSILLARVASLLKRAYPDSEAEGLSHKGVSLYLASGKLEYAGRTVELTKNEMKILHYLFLHKGAIVSRADIICLLYTSHRREFIRKISQTLNETELSEWDRYHHEKSPCNRVLPDCRGFFIMLWKKFLACRVFGFQK